MKKLILLIFFSPIFIGVSFASENHGGDIYKRHRADSHAPISIMGDYHHKQGEAMFSYRYILMDMDGYQKGSSGSNYTRARIKPSYGTYMTVPLNMERAMHMFGVMYALSDDYIVMSMINYNDNKMEIKRHSDGQKRTVNSKGWGDSKLTVMRRLFESEIVKIYVSLGLSLPTGSISKEDMMFGDSKRTLGYKMQLGSGTYDILPTLTYFHTRNDFSFGIQTSAEIRIGENSKNYTLGNRYKLNAWIAKPINQINSSFSLALKGESLDKVDGSHQEMTTIMSFAQDKESTGYRRVNFSVGMNYLSLFLPGLRFAIEYLRPVYNDVNQVQLELDHTILLGIQYSN